MGNNSNNVNNNSIQTVNNPKEFSVQRKGCYGESKFTIKEVDIDSGKIFYSIDGNDLEFIPIPLNSHIPAVNNNSNTSQKITPINGYLLIEEFKDTSLINVNLVYGAIDIQKLYFDDKYRKAIIGILSTDRIEKITRRNFGLLPYFDSNKLSSNNEFYNFIDSDLNNNETNKKAYYRIFDHLVEIKNDVILGSIETKYNEEEETQSNPSANKKKSLLRMYAEGLFEGVTFSKLNKKTPEKIEKDDKVVMKREIILLRNGATIIKGNNCSKFGCWLKDYTNKGKTDLYTYSIIVSRFKDDKVEIDPFYSKNFADSILSEGIIDTLKKQNIMDFNYAGEVGDDGVICVNEKMNRYFYDLNGIKNDYYDNYR